jgi:hypothetical protein
MLYAYVMLYVMPRGDGQSNNEEGPVPVLCQLHSHCSFMTLAIAKTDC